MAAPDPSGMNCDKPQVGSLLGNEPCLVRLKVSATSATSASSSRDDTEQLKVLLTQIEMLTFFLASASSMEKPKTSLNRSRRNM